MRSTEVCDAFCEHMRDDLEARFDKPFAELERHPTARLGRDSDGYRITPHPDSDRRVYTAQVYLPEDDSQEDVGTSIYRREPDGSFTLVRRLPFRPNTAFCFVPTENSFHGVEPISLTKPRNNLHISCFLADPGY